MKDQDETNTKIFSDLPPKKQKEAEANLKSYIKVVKRIYDRMSEAGKLRIRLRSEWEKRDQGKKSASQK